MFLFQEIFLVINGRHIVELFMFSLGNTAFLIQNIIKRFRVGPENRVGKVTGLQSQLLFRPNFTYLYLRVLLPKLSSGSMILLTITLELRMALQNI